MKNKPIYGLVCTGGGAHGAFQVGVLKYIHEHFCIGERSPFQIFTGCSCGSLNTSFFAAESFQAKTAHRRLEELWMSFHVPEYHAHILKIASLSVYKQFRRKQGSNENLWSLLDPQPMFDVILKGFLRKNLERALEQESTLSIGVVATELVSGRCCWFLEGQNALSWNLFHSVGKIERVSPAHLAASCSVPVFLPPVKLGERYFLDGSVSLERPLAAALAMGATRVLAISTEKPFPDELPTYHPRFKPRISNVIRMMLNRLATDKIQPNAVQIEVLNRFYEALSRKSRKQTKDDPKLPLFHEEAIPAHYHPAQIFQVHPSRRIREVVVDADFGRGEKVRSKTTRFMFHRKFIRHLIDLGYKDASQKHDELAKFFQDAGMKKKRFFFGGFRPEAV